MDRLSYNENTGFLPGLFGCSEKPSPPAQAPPEEGSTKPPSRRKTLQPQTFDIVERMPTTFRNELVAFAGEFVGTFLFLFMAFCGTQVANAPQSAAGDDSTTLANGPDPIQLFFISVVFGASLAVNAWIFYRVSGGLFNPAVTLALYLVGSVSLLRSIVVFCAQMLGGMASAAVVLVLLPGPMAVTTELGGGTNLSQGLFIEMFLTMQLVFTILMLAVEKHKSTFLAPIGIGASLFIAEMAGVYFTGASLNPARSFGPCVANASFPTEHWIYWAGPALGGILAASFYWLIKGLQFTTVNPGQDFDDIEANAFDPNSDLSRPVVFPGAVVERAIEDIVAFNTEGGRDLSSSPGRPRSAKKSSLKSGMSGATASEGGIPPVPIQEKADSLDEAPPHAVTFDQRRQEID